MCLTRAHDRGGADDFGVDIDIDFEPVVEATAAEPFVADDTASPVATPDHPPAVAPAPEPVAPAATIETAVDATPDDHEPPVLAAEEPTDAADSTTTSPAEEVLPPATEPPASLATGLSDLPGLAETRSEPASQTNEPVPDLPDLDDLAASLDDAAVEPAPASDAVSPAAQTSDAADDEFEIPELINDTMPDLETLPEPFVEPVAPEAPVSRVEMLEPRAPEPLTAAEPADTQTVKALDSALRPDTQLLEALEPSPEQAATDGEPPQLPTLSADMRLDEPAESSVGDGHKDAKKPDLKKLEAALAVARKGPMAVASEPSLPEQTPPVQPAASVPEITLDQSIDEQRQEAAAKIAEAEAKLEAEREAREAEQRDDAAIAAAEELATEKKRLSGMSTISQQFATGQELSLAETGELPKPPVDEPELPGADATIDAASDDTETPKDRDKLERVARNLVSATTLEDIDEIAAETLFGEEITEIAKALQAFAPEEAETANDVEAELQLELEATMQSEALSTPTPPPANPAAVPSPANGSAVPAAPPPAAAAAARPPMPPPGSKPDIDSSAMRRLAMVRSLNKGKAPAAPPPMRQPTEEIVLGSEPAMPTGPKPEPIEDQFGTSMTANLKALSEESVKSMQAAESVEQPPEEKKGGLFSRFRRS